jgi:hypothetical protein
MITESQRDKLVLLAAYQLLTDMLNADPRALAVLDLTDPEMLPAIRQMRERMRQGQ